MVEDIEILRFFDLNIKIKMIKLNSNSIAVDEKNDVKKVEKFLKKMIKNNKKFVDPLIKERKIFQVKFNIMIIFLFHQLLK